MLISASTVIVAINAQFLRGATLEGLFSVASSDASSSLRISGGVRVKFCFAALRAEVIRSVVFALASSFRRINLHPADDIAFHD